MKNKIIIIVSLLLVLIGIITIIIYKDNSNNKIVSAYDEIFDYQKKMDDKIKEYSKDKKYTLNNPCVILNPYKLAPLTALIIFNTEEEEQINVSINNRFKTSLKASKEHIIPIYGMYADYDNKIKITTKNSEKEIIIKTDKYEGDIITLEKTTKQVENDLYFLSPNFVNNVIIDGNGKVLWYISGGYAGDIEFLENGHFYISDPNQGTNGVKINYSSFVEMDFLGKIYKQWISEYGLHHEIYPMKDNKALILGFVDNSPFFDSIIYIMDLQNGEILYKLDLYEFLHDIDPTLIESLGNDFDLVNNAADYNEDTNELLISLRGLNSLMKLNLETKEIKWIFGDPKFWGEKFSKYMLKVTDNTRYLGGQHTAYYTKDNLIAVHNNDIDQFDLSNYNLSHYLNRYSTSDLLQVDEKNMTIKTVWQYKSLDKIFSNVGGHIEFENDNSKLITYGWAMKKDAYNNPENIIYTDPIYKEGIVIKLDKNDNVLFKATMPGLIYRTFQIDGFYNKKISNYEIIPFERINSTKVNGNVTNTNNIKLLISSKFKDKIDIYTNRIYLHKNFKLEDKVELLFVQGNKTITYTYKEKNKEAPKSFNSGLASLKVNLKSGKYKLYININDKIYNPNLIIEF